MSAAATSGRILVTGASGMLGSELLLSAPAGVDAVGTDLREAPEGFPTVDAVGVDLSDEAAVSSLLREAGPFHGVIHAAAYTAVDRAEEEEELALRVNGTAAGVMARACKEHSLPLVLVSTDFVFDGTKGSAYGEDEPTSPLSAYGRTKLAGELAAREAHPEGTRIVRTQWLYGPRGNHFPGTILRLASERDHLKVVHDQIGSPTSTQALAPALWDVLGLGQGGGIYHAACAGQCSWFEFASAVLEEAGVEGVRIEPCTTAEFPRPAARPAFSVLNCERLASLRGTPMPAWRDALATFLATPA